jgi:hypothetical protein
MGCSAIERKSIQYFFNPIDMFHFRNQCLSRSLLTSVEIEKCNDVSDTNETRLSCILNLKFGIRPADTCCLTCTKLELECCMWKRLFCLKAETLKRIDFTY